VAVSAGFPLAGSCTIIAMNPLSGVLDEAWGMYRRFAGHFLAIAFVIYLVAAVIAALLSLLGFFGAFLGAIVGFFAAFLVQAALIKAVQDVRDGRADLSLGETVSAATPYIWAVAGASILAGIAITIGLILLIVPGLYLITIWAVFVPAIVIERSGVFGSFGRSYRLVRGHGWHVFGTLVLVFIILILVNIVLGLIFFALPVLLRSGLSTVISGTLIAPFLALVVTLIYYRLTGAEAGNQGPVQGQQWPAQGQQGPMGGDQGPVPGQQGPVPGQQGPVPGEQGPANGNQGPANGNPEGNPGTA
jgi:hypothetical protein